MNAPAQRRYYAINSVFFAKISKMFHFARKCMALSGVTYEG
jgi:hypothetical protein